MTSYTIDKTNLLPRSSGYSQEIVRTTGSRYNLRKEESTGYSSNTQASPLGRDSRIIQGFFCTPEIRSDPC